MPLFVFDLALTWPETRGAAKGNLGRTSDSVDEVAAVTMAVAHVLSGHALSTNTPSAYKLIAEQLAMLNVPEARVAKWAQSILLAADVTVPLDAVPKYNRAFKFTLHDYQRETAAWGARRAGSLMALGCGVGKTASAVAAAIGAVELGNTSRERCLIICPVNAQSVWEVAKLDLQGVFKTVTIYSIDSVHHFDALDPGPGGVLIVDEAHKAKGEASRRTNALRKLRRCFDWATCLTGSLLDSGPEGLVALHDIACPGLSRFMAPMDFGRNFKCIATTQLGRGRRQRLVIPGDDARQLMVPYLARSSRSLSFTSPEVAKVVHMEAHRDLVEDTWARPAWVPENDDAFLWAPETTWQTYMGAMAVCTMHDDRDDLIAFCNANAIDIPLMGGGRATGVPEHIEVDWQAMQAAFKKTLDNPFFPAEQAKVLRPLAKLGGLASFPRVMHSVLREGRHARTIRKCIDSAIGSTFRWVYAPGCSRDNPGEGPKLAWARNWLTANPKEQLVLGAGGRATVTAAKTLLDGMGVTYQAIEGGVAAEDRGTFCKDFQAGAFRVMLLQQVAGSESVTLTAAATSVLLDHDLRTTAYTQYIHRTYRQGQKRASEHYDLVFGERQADLLAMIQRGRSFDQVTRDKLEAQARSSGARFG